MSLSAREQQALDLIKDRLTNSDSGLAALLGTFNRLAVAEEMPAREKIQPGSPGAAGCARRGRHPHGRCRYPGQQAQRPVRQWTAPALLFLITLSLITVALVFSRNVSPVKCAAPLAMVCSKSDSARSLSPALGSHS
jgi:hypothetical protein